MTRSRLFSAGCIRLLQDFTGNYTVLAFFEAARTQRAFYFFRVIHLIHWSQHSAADRGETPRDAEIH